MAIVSPLERPDYRVRLRPLATLRAFGPRGVLRVLRRERLTAERVDYHVRPRGYPAPLGVRPRTSDWYSLHQVFVERPYEEAAVGRPRTVVDAGAYVGYVAAFLLARDPACRVFALEPEAASFERLRANLEPFGSRGRALRLALWPEPARLRVVQPPPHRRQEWGAQVLPAAPGEPGDVEGIDPRALLDRLGLERVDLLKIDVEGAEAALFAAGVASWIDRVATLAVEIHGVRAAAALAAALPAPRFEHTRAGEMTLVRARA